MARIYDTFLFDGELDLLEHRLRQNFDATDVFVLVEAAETYRGKRKPLTFAANAQRFAWAASKLRAIRLPSLGPSASSPRQRAAVQRNAIRLALHDATADDVVLLLDADEIPSLSVLENLRSTGLVVPHRLAMTRHYQRLNLLAPASTCCVNTLQPFAFAANHQRPASWHAGTTWSGRSGVAIPFGILQTAGRTPYEYRFCTRIDDVLPNAGRHLTAVDPSAHLSQKLGRVFHAEWATDRGTYAPHLARCEHHAVHHRGWWYAETVPGQLPGDLAQLATAYPATNRTEALPAMYRRRCVRTWAWLRQSTLLTGGLVRHIDDHYDTLFPLLLPVLLLADGLRFLAANILKREPRINLRAPA